MELRTNHYRELRDQDPALLTPRDRILRSAVILFNKHGIHTTGIDRIISDSDVAKMTFYKHFPSKTNLIMAYLEYKHEARFSNLRKHTVEKSADPFKQILGIFDSLEDWFHESDFNGCPFVRGLTEFGEEKDSPVYALVEEHFSQWSSFLEERLIKILKPSSVKASLIQLITLVVGSVIVALAIHDPKVARTNKKLAEALLKAAPHK